MSGMIHGYARVSTERQDLSAQLKGLASLGVAAERICPALEQHRAETSHSLVSHDRTVTLLPE